MATRRYELSAEDVYRNVKEGPDRVEGVPFLRFVSDTGKTRTVIAAMRTLEDGRVVVVPVFIRQPYRGGRCEYRASATCFVGKDEAQAMWYLRAWLEHRTTKAHWYINLPEALTYTAEERESLVKKWTAVARAAVVKDWN